MNKFVKGTCTDARGSYTDTCIDDTRIGEYFCIGDSCVGYVDNTCPPDAPRCVDGACIK